MRIRISNFAFGIFPIIALILYLLVILSASGLLWIVFSTARRLAENSYHSLLQGNMLLHV